MHISIVLYSFENSFVSFSVEPKWFRKMRDSEIRLQQVQFQFSNSVFKITRRIEAKKQNFDVSALFV